MLFETCCGMDCYQCACCQENVKPIPDNGGGGGGYGPGPQPVVPPYGGGKGGGGGYGGGAGPYSPVAEQPMPVTYDNQPMPVTYGPATIYPPQPMPMQISSMP